MVQGADNGKYLSTGFSGKKNPSGAVFMDFRIKEGFDSAFVVLYGHNMQDGSMFAELNHYLDEAYLNASPEITVITLEGETLTYGIFAVRVTDASDPVARLDFSGIVVPEGAGRILVLSTCTDGGDEDARLLLFAATD